MPDNELEILACVFCGGRMLLLDISEIANEDGNRPVRIQCPGCGASGPVQPNVFRAITAWNRSPNSPLFSEEGKPPQPHARLDLLSE